MPPGWSLATLDVGAFMDDGPRHWQLFGAGDATPVDRGVLVASEAQDARTIEGATRRVHGQPAWVGPPADPAHPAGAINASWAEDGVVHDVISVGLDEDELVVFLDGLVRRDEPISGFDVSDPTLPELASATVAGVRTTSATFVGPGGPADAVRVTAESTDRYGGLLHRLDGDERYGFVRQARDDGWSVEVLSDGSVTAADDPSVLDVFLSALRPATAQQLEELAVAQPVTATLDAGLGRTVELHGTAGEDMGLCLARQGGGDTVCGVAEALPEPGTLVASSLVVDGRWVVVTITDDRPPHVRTDPEYLEWASESQLSDRGGPADGQILVSVLHAPQEAATVAITVPTSDDTASGFTYENPLR